MKFNLIESEDSVNLYDVFVKNYVLQPKAIRGEDVFEIGNSLVVLKEGEGNKINIICPTDNEAEEEDLIKGVLKDITENTELVFIAES